MSLLIRRVILGLLAIGLSVASMPVVMASPSAAVTAATFSAPTAVTTASTPACRPDRSARIINPDATLSRGDPTYNVDAVNVCAGTRKYRLFNVKSGAATVWKRVPGGARFSLAKSVGIGRTKVKVKLQSIGRGESTSSTIDTTVVTRGVRQLADIIPPGTTKRAAVFIINPTGNAMIANVFTREGGGFRLSSYGDIKPYGQLVLNSSALDPGQIAEVKVTLNRGKQKLVLQPFVQTWRKRS